MSGGFIGVDAFFVLSGYLITLMLLHHYQDHGNIGISSFYLRRARRILPTATLVLLTTSAAGVAILGVDASRDLLVSAAWTAVFLGNVHLISNNADYFNSNLPSPFQQYWSLAVEEQFYLLWPLLLLLGLWAGRRLWTPRVGALAVALATVIVSFAINATTTETEPVAAYFSTTTRAWELAAGALLALLAGRLPRLPKPASVATALLGIALLLASAALLNEATPYPGTAALLPVTGALLVIYGGRHHTKANPLTSAPLVHLGNISYATYLWHWPLLILPLYLTGEQPTTATAAGLLGLSIGLGWATTSLLENPLRNWTLLAHGPTMTGVGALSVLGPLVLMSPLLTAPPASTLGLNAGSVKDVATQVTVESVASAAAPITDQTRPTLNQLSRDTGNHVDYHCMSSPSSSEVLACDFGDPSGTNHIIVFGDSHAGMWTPGLDTWGQSSDTRVTLIAKTSCSPWHLSMWKSGNRAPHHTCDPWRESALAYIEQTRPDLVLIGGNVNNVTLADNGQPVADELVINAMWRAGAARTLTRLTGAGITVAVMQDVPSFTQDLHACLATHRSDTRECSQIREPATYLRRLEIEREAIEAAGAHLIPTYDWFCQNGRCPIIINDIIAYRDSVGHITATYATWLSGILGERVSRLLPGYQPDRQTT